MEAWHALSAQEAARRLETDARHGLTEEEARKRLERDGPNTLAGGAGRPAWRILLEQFTAAMVLVLIAAAGVSAVIGHGKDAAVILVIVVLNSLLGFQQEFRAERAMAALKKLAVPVARARRGGKTRELSSEELVAGDIVLLEPGTLVPADCRLTVVVNLRAQEAALTGESEAVEKSVAAPVAPDAPLGDRRNMTFRGTAITYGRGEGVVTATGMRTELGRIAGLLQKVDREPTPLQRRLEQVGKRLGLVALALVAVVFGLGLLRGEPADLMLMTAISLGVAAVPEGLPAVVTIALALGAQRMLKRKALVRRLAAVETLGSVTVICSDKTGTLTENRMRVIALDTAGHPLEITEDLHRAHPVKRGHPPASADPSQALLLAGAALCSDSALAETPEGEVEAVGDPTEDALVMAAARFGLWKDRLEQELARTAELPFDSERKRMTVVLAPAPAPGDRSHLGGLAGPGGVAVTKGAVDGLLGLSTSLWNEGRPEPMTGAWRERVVKAHDRMARDGMRVLGVAVRTLEVPLPEGPVTPEALERDLVFVGLIGMADPPRAAAREAVATCVAAGIRPVMITGDHPLTAAYVARELGIGDAGEVLSGQEMERFSAEELKEVAGSVAIYARVAPEQKLLLVEALRGRGEVVAMTGDGVNDAPALKRADIGVAMGITGTDVAKEAADMVLLDDNFSTIVAAVEEGRIIYDNIRKFIKYLLTTNAAEIWVMLAAPWMGMPLPLLPLQILWINLVTDGLPALALGVEPAERGVMRRPPHPSGESIFARGLGRHALWVGFLMAGITLGIGFTLWKAGDPRWQTAVFTTLAFTQMAHVTAIRSERESLFRMGLLSNPALAGAVLLTLGMQMAVVYLPWGQDLFLTEPLSPALLGLCFAASGIIFWAVEAEKWLLRRRSPRGRRR